MPVERHILPFEKQLKTVKPGRRTRPPPVGSALPLRMQKPTKLVRAAVRPLTAVSARKGPPWEISTFLSDALAD